MSNLACAIVLLCVGLPVLPGTATPARADTPADTPAATEPVSETENFTLQGTVLRYDTESGEIDDEISKPDVEALLKMLRDNDGITTLSLNSSGGSVWSAKEMARIVIDFELDTHVDGTCSSSCVGVVLGGQVRSMARGSKIGFHSRNWSPAATKRYYEQWREDEGWDTPFEFASWVYRDTYAEAYEDITWTISRGVTAEFAVEIHAPRESMWFPTRTTLRDSGVLRD